MSFRRSLSFKETEEELVKYYDENGQSEIAKAAMRFYKEHKNKIFIDNIKDIIHLITQPTQSIQPKRSGIPESKMQKLMK